MSTKSTIMKCVKNLAKMKGVPPADIAKTILDSVNTIRFQEARGVFRVVLDNDTKWIASEIKRLAPSGIHYDTYSFPFYAASKVKNYLDRYQKVYDDLAAVPKPQKASLPDPILEAFHQGKETVKISGKPLQYYIITTDRGKVDEIVAKNEAKHFMIQSTIRVREKYDDDSGKVVYAVHITEPYLD